MIASKLEDWQRAVTKLLDCTLSGEYVWCAVDAKYIPVEADRTLKYPPQAFWLLAADKMLMLYTEERTRLPHIAFVSGDFKIEWIWPDTCHTPALRQAVNEQFETRSRIGAFLTSFLSEGT